MTAEIPDSWRPAIAGFKEMFAELSAESVEANAASVYADDARFDDTLKRITGGPAIAEYLTESSAAVESCTVEFDDVARAIDGVYVRWRMRIVAKRLARGEPIDSPGITHLRFDDRGKVVSHQDYWDSGSNLFAHIPLIGWAIRKIKARL